MKKKSPLNQFLIDKYNELNAQIKYERFKLRTQYNSDITNKHANDPKRMWKHINEVIYNKNTQNNSLRALNNNEGNITTNTKQIANTLNDYFADVGKSLHDNLSQSNLSIILPMSNRANTQSMLLWNVNEGEVFTKIHNLKNSKSVKDFIPSKLLKENARLMAPVLCKFINQSFSEGKFPNELKCSRIVPIFKDGNPLTASNYRPISILSCISKVEESLLYDRINDFALKNNIIDKNQFGFQKKSGALSAATTLIDHIQTSLDQKRNSIACCVFIDLKKTFDTISHASLLAKLNDYGMRGKINDMIASYLKDRAQYVDMNDTFSDRKTNHNEFGLPQGSNLGPLLFILYINGIFDLPLNGKLILFADDAELTYSDNNIDIVKSKMQSDLNLISAWLIKNKLTLNAEKTKYMIVKTQSASARTNDFNLSINNTMLQRVALFKYLGVTIQENLKWNLHTNSICGKLAGITGALKRLGNKIQPSAKLSLYFSMCNSFLSYLSPVWSSSITQNEINQLQVAQNNAIRTIFSYEYNVQQLSTAEIMKKFKILNVKQSIRFNNLTMMFKIDNKQMKSNYTIDRTSVHNYATRFGSRPRLGAIRTSLGQKSIFRSCTEEYAALDPSLLVQPTIRLFKQKLKISILDEN